MLFLKLLQLLSKYFAFLSSKNSSFYYFNWIVIRVSSQICVPDTLVVQSTIYNLFILSAGLFSTASVKSGSVRELFLVVSDAYENMKNDPYSKCNFHIVW